MSKHELERKSPRAACGEGRFSPTSGSTRGGPLVRGGLDRILEKHCGKPGALIRVLIEIQRENRWLPREVLVEVAQALGVPLSRTLQVATFYKTFSLTPRGRHEVRVCTGTSCHLRGAARLLATVRRLIGIKPGETDAESRFSLETGTCLGSCSLGPEMTVDGAHYGRMTAAKAEDVLNRYR